MSAPPSDAAAAASPEPQGDQARAHLAVLAESMALPVLTGIARGEVPADGFAPLGQWLEGAGPASPLRRMAEGFDLSRAELELVVLLLAADTSERVARAAAEATSAHGGVVGGGLPVWLACRAVAGLCPSVLAAALPLVRFGIVEPEPASPRIEARLALAAPVLDRLLGRPVRDPLVSSRMAPLPVPAAGPGEEGDLPAALGRSLASRGPLGLPPLVLVPGVPPEEIATALAALGLTPWRMSGSDVPEDAGARDLLAARWSREAMLESAALVIDAVDGPSEGPVAAFADRVLGHVLLTGQQVPDGIARGVHVVPAPGDGPGAAGRRWAAALGPDRAARLGHGVERVAAQFRLDAKGIATAAAEAAEAVDAAPDAAGAAAALWHVAARSFTPSPLPGVHLVEPAYGWEDIVLPPATEAALRRVESHVRHAARVFDDWGFAARVGGRGSWRGRGVAALFCGPSGTGKTMAAEVLASALDVRVMVIDLSRIISKWVGETSKNVAAVFDAAERSGSMMVWNEGDAVWGTRGGVANATDRHVNAEVGDLLQRIETFSGFTVITTNLRQAIDPAFMRRFRFVVDFPLPSVDERRRLWCSAFPPQAPVEAVRWDALAALPLTGGSIRNVALGAAFLAAEVGRPVDRAMIEAELAEELRKQNLPVPHVAWEATA
ncbi:ATP-binding protein [Streptomyces sp. I05A-00742]|uniref:ATP-binding protein n=1 Tax=Streptomyces sp. I05A-00742 TaxID=2732853 RepID=UPI001488E56C|nr:ATP-binding protein [Streptomyces sp. I05A-00742]